MLQLIHELSLWAAFAVIIGACLYVEPVAGVGVGLMAAAYVLLIQRRREP